MKHHVTWTTSAELITPTCRVSTLQASVAHATPAESSCIYPQAGSVQAVTIGHAARREQRCIPRTVACSVQLQTAHGLLGPAACLRRVRASSKKSSIACAPPFGRACTNLSRSRAERTSCERPPLRSRRARRLGAAAPRHPQRMRDHSLPLVLRASARAAPAAGR